MKINFKYFILVFLTFSSYFFPQVKPGAKQIALAHSDVALTGNLFSLFNNSAALSLISERQIGLYYSPSPFGIEELANGFLAVTQPTNIGNINLGMMDYGFSLYKENKFIVGYSKQIAENLLFGVNLYYHYLKIKNYGSRGTFNFSFGSIVLLNNNFSIGFNLENPIRYNNDNLYLPLIYKVGMSYSTKTETSASFALEKEINFPLSFSLGINYELIKYLSLRFGIKDEPALFSGGIGIFYSFMNINYAVSSHQELGISHQFDVIIQF